MASNSTREWSKRGIKGVTTEQLEDAIATAISTLTGTTYEVEIAAMDLAAKGPGLVGDTTDIRLRVSTPLRDVFGAAKGSESSAENPS